MTHPHQYIERDSRQVATEKLFGDRFVNWLYGPTREKAPMLFKALTSARACRLLSYYNFDRASRKGPWAALKMAKALKIELKECCAPEVALQSTRALFERQIAYWRCRPIPDDPDGVVSPCDAKLLIGSLEESTLLFVKEKFFSYDELLGNRSNWPDLFRSGDFALFRLTPEKYHYTHAPSPAGWSITMKRRETITPATPQR